MIQKFQLGGQQDAIMLFVQGLALTLLADPQQIAQAAQLNPEALKAAVQTYQQTQDMNQAAQVFAQALLQQKRVARHGAKLQYLRSLKNQCPEGEELYYYKKGGSVGCGCKKKEDEGKIQEAKCGAVVKFKKARKAEPGTKIMLLTEANKLRKAKEATEAAAKEKQLEKAKTWGGSLIYYADKNATYGNKKEPEEQDNAVRDRKENPENNRINKVPRKACGSKIKKDCNGAVAKFKAACGSKIKKNQLGGSLNGIPFSSLFSLLPKNNSNSTLNPFNSKENIESLKKKKMVAKPKIWQAPIYSNTLAQIIRPYLSPGSRKYSPPKTLYVLKGGIVDSATEMIPVYGTYKAGLRFFNNPTWKGAAEFGVSALGDLALVTGVGAGAGLALKGAKAAKNVAKGISSATRAVKAEKAKKYYDASTRAFNDATILYGGSSAGKAIAKLDLK